MTRNAFALLAKNDPEKLGRILRFHRKLSPALRGFAAEEFGKSELDAFKRFAILMPCLEAATQPLEREGIVLGLEPLLQTDFAGITAELLAFVAERDASPGVREAAREALEEME